MTLKLVDPNSGLYVSEDRIGKEPQFPSAYFKKQRDGWYLDQANDIYYRYDDLLQRVLACKFQRHMAPFLTDQELIQFSNKQTIY